MNKTKLIKENMVDIKNNLESMRISIATIDKAIYNHKGSLSEEERKQYCTMLNTYYQKLQDTVEKSEGIKLFNDIHKKAYNMCMNTLTILAKVI